MRRSGPLSTSPPQGGGPANNVTTFDFLMANQLIASQRLCPDCKGDMKLVTSSRASDLKI